MTENLNKIAQIDVPLYPDGGLSGPGPLGNPSNPASTFNNVISGIVGIMTVIAGIWFLFLVISGAISIMGAGGDKAAVEEGRKRIMNGIIGIVVVIAAIFLVDLVGNILGFGSILNPAKFIENFSF